MARSADDSLLAACHARAVDLLKANTTAHGVLAASPAPRAEERGYTAIFGRDAAVCALGMALSGDRVLEREAPRGLETLAAHQATNGQIPKFVDPAASEADFWYLGCIDATLWWLLGLAFLDARRSSPRLRKRFAREIARAVDWLRAQEHQRFRLLQQNEASDWADIMPRSGFVLYTNALWYRVKRAYGLEHAAETRASFNGLFHPFSAKLPEYRRARLLNEYALNGARNRDLYLSFVNFSFFGEEGDVLGNVLAILSGAASRAACRRTLDALLAARVHEPYPVRAVVEPIRKASALWRPYMARHRQNLAWQYHNGGVWPMLGGFWIAALVRCGRRRLAREELVKLARACELGGWAFTEWLHGKTGKPRGMPGQSWSAAAYLMAESAVRSGTDPFET
ncbi:MAG TPA: glycoside hydrolase 100 family protein [Gammaproteobacteria bacterium]|nr:glycoside hydrolase 100 family protein [Gammaproteobacteria bacterium]